MSTETTKKVRRTRHGFLFGIVVGGILGAVVAGAAVGAASPMLAVAALGHGEGPHDAEAVRDRAEFAARFVLERVDATDEQQAEVRQIVSETVNDIWPLADEHRANRDALHDALRQADIDPEAIEQIRQSEMVLADQASRELTEALTRFAQTLTVDQRSELMEMKHRLHR